MLGDKMREAIIVFTRVPIPGQTKTRLEKMITKEQCAKIHINFLKDIKSTCNILNRDVFVFYTPEDKNNIIKNIFGKGINYKIQEGNDLGEKMFNAIKYVLNKNYKSCILVGSDIPYICVEDLEKSFLILKEKDIVLGPTEDKGYYLVGMKKPIKVIFKDIEYGYGNVLKNTIETIKNANLTYNLTNENRDIDEPKDLEYFYEEIKKGNINKDMNTSKFIKEIFEEYKNV